MKKNENFKDRRKKESNFKKFAAFVSYVNVVIGVSLFFIFDSWMPKGETFFDRIYSVNREDVWEFDNISLFVILLSFMFFSSSVALLLNLKHLKRENDRVNGLLIIEFILSWLVIILYFSL
jgi:uncharacterized BrkB/YihY/UPF0761 family membrane protein